MVKSLPDNSIALQPASEIALLHLRFFFGISGLGEKRSPTAIRHLSSPSSMQLPLIASPSPPETATPSLELIGTQGDIRYYDQPAKGVLNGPEVTGMGFWSINP
jgi:hypothetical protein